MYVGKARISDRRTARLETALTGIKGNPDSALIEYKIQIIPTITNHIFDHDGQKNTVDASWRGISMDEPVTIRTPHGEIDINSPRTALDVMVPGVSERFGTVEILNVPLVDASGIKDLPISRWHFLFDPTAILHSVQDFIGENVVSHYSMGECNILVGVCDDRQWIEQINLDETYTIKMIESRDDAVIALEGYAGLTYVGGFEVFQVSLNAPIADKAGDDDFLVMAMYGMAAMGMVGAVAMFAISNHKLKRDKNEGQTGIDPSRLKAYSTSSSAGGYRTNRVNLA